jgi:coenzyme F420-reducing hydrogenase gamma subunit
MRTMLAMCFVMLGACASGGGREQERPEGVTRTAVDTEVTTRQVEDTTVVRTDTTIRADTAVEVDTVRTGEPPDSRP